MPIPHTDLSRMLETAVVAARLAGQRAMEELRYVHTTVKNGNELVTQADPICQKIIMDRIREAYPDHGVIGEEGEDGALLSIPPRSGTPFWWVIDPIDGTNNFANGMLCFSVSIAAMLDGVPILGVIFEPATDSMYTAALDMDALLNGSRITVNEEEIDRFTSFGVDSHPLASIETGKQKIMKQTRYRCLGSTALHMAYVARGAMVGMVTPGAKLWDIAAGIILVERAGGIVTNVQGKPLLPVDLDNYNAEQLPTLATNQKIHGQVLEIFSQK
ncbi:MAG: inositol monophosphatase family protein [Planctomycetota bacterium]